MYHLLLFSEWGEDWSYSIRNWEQRGKDFYSAWHVHGRGGFSDGMLASILEPILKIFVFNVSYIYIILQEFIFCKVNAPTHFGERKV